MKRSVGINVDVNLLHDDDGDVDISTSKTYVTQAQANNNDPNPITNDLINVAEVEATSVINDMVADTTSKNNGDDDESLSLQNDDPNLIAYNEENVEFISLLDKGNRAPKYVVHDNQNGGSSGEIINATQPRILVNVSIATDTGKGTLVHAVYMLHVEVPATADFPIPIHVPPFPSTSSPHPPPPATATAATAFSYEHHPPPAHLTLLSPPLVVDIDDDYTESPIISSTAEENTVEIQFSTAATSTTTITSTMSNDENEVDDVITTSEAELATPISFEANAEMLNCANHTIPYVLILEGERHTYTQFINAFLIPYFVLFNNITIHKWETHKMLSKL